MLPWACPWPSDAHLVAEASQSQPSPVQLQGREFHCQRCSCAWAGEAPPPLSCLQAGAVGPDVLSMVRARPSGIKASGVDKLCRAVPLARAALLVRACVGRILASGAPNVELVCCFHMTIHRCWTLTETLPSPAETSSTGPNGVTGGSVVYFMGPPMACGGVMATALAFSSGDVSM